MKAGCLSQKLERGNSMTPKRLLLIFVYVLISMIAIPSWSASINDIVERITTGQGKVQQVFEGERGQIIVFEESHNSRVGQVEIAHMLVRLYKQYGLRAVGLEGAFPSDGQLRPPWAAGMDSVGRLRLAARLLGEGEINSAEFIATAFPDALVKGIDDQIRYKAEVGDKAAVAKIMYLVKIAERNMAPDQIASVNALFKAKKIDDAINLIIGSDSWTKQKYTQMSQKCPNVVSAEDMVRQLDEIQNEAISRNVRIDSQTSEGMQELKKFFQLASERNAPMVHETIALAKPTTNNPVAMIIGAAHTAGVSKLLRDLRYTFAVITPLALIDCDEVNNLESDAYVRKTKGKSVDSSGLGSILDGRKKPPTVINRLWMRSKANTYYAISMIARAAASGEKPPFNSLAMLDKLEGVNIDKNTYRIDNGEVIFQANIEDENGKWQRIWIRVGCETANCSGKIVTNRDKKSIERRIDELIAETGGGDGKGPPQNGDKKLTTGGSDGNGKSGNEKGKGEENKGGEKKVAKEAREIDPGIYVIISKDRSAVEKPVLIGES